MILNLKSIEEGFMKHISILVLQGAILGNVEGPRQVFAEANRFLIAMGKEPAFDIKLIGLTQSTLLNDGLYTVNNDYALKNARQTDLVIIPAMYGDLQKALELNHVFIPWIIDQYKNGAEIASLCLGAFLLASTGLLNGRNCATHWIASNEFIKMFPDVNLVVDKIITDEFGIYSSGGAYSSLNLILYLIEKFSGRDIAILCSKAFQIDIDRGSQSPFMIFKGQKEHEDEPVKKAQEYIEQNFQSKISVEQLASIIALSRRNLERRFKKATTNTVVEYIQRVKVEAAKMSLESSGENVNEVMYKVGYSDPKAFRETFRKITGLSPVEYRNKYNREANQLSPVS
jgi:transcriptional regulator GlxA family with amidase domain